MAAEEKTDRWGFDKRIPVAVVVALILQFVGTITYVVNLDNRVAGIEKAIAVSSSKDGETSREARLVLERLVRLEEKLSALFDYVRRIDAPSRRSELP